MAIQKKHGKGRLDKYYRLAKEKGYRARAAFKLIQLNKKYHVLEKSRVVLDLCAAPGSWCQVASEVTPVDSLIIGVDLAPIKPLPRVITFQSDITTAQCRATIRQHIKHLKADLVLHDGAPNVGTAWVQDAFTQAELVLQSLRLATDFLRAGGSFITKIFRSRDYNSLLWVFNQLFGKVEATKPPSSRDVSAEIFVVCLDFKAPKKIDPRLLDPRSVFAELAAPAQNNEARVFNPEQKKRKRDGYEEGNWTQFKEAPVSEFVQTLDPIAILGTLNKLSFQHRPNGDLALSALEQLPETTQEVKDCCADLKVLGRKEFRLLLRWRLRVRERFGFSQKQKPNQDDTSEEVAAVEDMDDEMRIQEEMQRLRDQNDTRKKKEKRKDNERKRKELVRLQMNMTTPDEIGLEQLGPLGEDSMFGLQAIERANASNRIARGKMHSINPKAQLAAKDLQAMRDDSEEEEDEQGDALEQELDELYQEYQERRAEKDPKYRSKRARTEHDDDFEGFSDQEEHGVSSDEEIVEDDDSDNSSDEGGLASASASREHVPAVTGLSRRATTFFDQDMFRGIADDDQEGEDATSSTNTQSGPSRLNKDTPPSDATARHKQSTAKIDVETSSQASSSEGEGGFEVVKEDYSGDESWSENPSRARSTQGRPDIDIITAEAMTLAHTLATGKQTKQSLIDDNFNKYTLRDVDGLPEWFLDDENQHSKLQRPITKEAAAAIKEKLRALNARPIKKVAEAKARKKFKAAQQLEKLKRKSALLVDDDDMTEKDKAQSIQKLMSKAAKKKPRKQVSVVVARGGNRGISGRPRGTKGKYKMVDARLKKDVRAAKRIAKRQKR